MSIRLHQMIGGLVARLDFALVVLEQHMPTPWLADLAERLTEARAEIACDYLHCGEPGGCPAHSGNGHLEDFAGQLWVCDRCGFSFDARHTSSDGALHGTAHYCPVCSEAHLERIGFAMSAELDDLRAQLRDSARAIQEGIDLIGKLGKEMAELRDTLGKIASLYNGFVNGEPRPDWAADQVLAAIGAALGPPWQDSPVSRT